MKNYLDLFKRELRNRNYAYNTIKHYSYKLKLFLSFAEENDISDPGERISLFLDSFKNSPSQRSIAWHAVRLFYQIILQKECPYNLEKVKKRKRIPNILLKGEIIEILNRITNQKHQMMISILYGSGLRISELINLKVKDIDINNLYLHIKNAKGHKDRITLLSDRKIDVLKNLIHNKKPNNPVFFSVYKKKYSARTVQKIFSRALAKTTIKKHPTCHTLRHCFATHLIENGVSIKRVKELMGHKSIKTTSIYLRLADPINKNIKSPL